MIDYFEYGFKDNKASHTHNYLIPYIFKILKKNNLKKILDVGCGNGSLAISLLKSGFDVYGTDASINGIEIAKRSYPDRFYIHNIQNNKLPDELSNMIFDTIISTEVIEHLFDPRNYIRFCKNILSEYTGGTLIISTPYHGYLKNLFLSLFNKWDQHINPLWDGGHIKFWSEKTLFQLLKEFNFNELKFYGCGRIPYLWKSMIVTGKFKDE